MGDDDKSWRDIDRQKDRSSHVNRDDDQSEQTSRRGDGPSAEYKRDLEKLFKPDAEVPDRFKDAMEPFQPEAGSEEAERKEAIQRLRDVEGFRDFAKEVNRYMTRGFALPEDENLLLRMLDHPDNDIVRQVMEHLVGISMRRDLERTEPIKSRLQTVRTMTDDTRLHELADKLEEALE